MKRCKEILALNDPYLEDSMTPFQRFKFRLHLMMCRRCRTYTKLYKAFIDKLHEQSIELTNEDEIERTVIAIRQIHITRHHDQ